MNLDIKLEFEGGHLRPLLETDLHKNYIEGLNNPKVNQYLVAVKSETQSNATVSQFIKHNLDANNAILFGIWLQEYANHCGTVRLHSIEHHHHTAHIGICLFDQTVWGKRVGSKVIDAVTRWAINYFKLRWVEASAYEENIASQKAFLSAGYNWMYDISNKYLLNGKPSIVKVYAYTPDSTVNQ